jgi:hypothetical protein
VTTGVKRVRRSRAKDKLCEMIEEAIEARLEELLAYCDKHRLTYQLDIKVWTWGETHE